MLINLHFIPFLSTVYLPLPFPDIPLHILLILLKCLCLKSVLWLMVNNFFLENFIQDNGRLNSRHAENEKMVHIRKVLVSQK